MSYALAKGVLGGKFRVGMNLIKVSCQPGKIDNVCFGDGACGRYQLLANFKLFKVLASWFVSELGHVALRELDVREPGWENQRA